MQIEVVDVVAGTAKRRHHPRVEGGVVARRNRMRVDDEDSHRAALGPITVRSGSSTREGARPPLLTVSRGDLSRYACGIAGIGLISNLIFLFFPTSAPRPVGATGDAAYGLVLASDTPLNACPSLHASLAVFTALWSERLCRHRGHPWGWRMAVSTWTLTMGSISAAFLLQPATNRQSAAAPARAAAEENVFGIEVSLLAR